MQGNSANRSKCEDQLFIQICQNLSGSKDHEFNDLFFRRNKDYNFYATQRIQHKLTSTWKILCGVSRAPASLGPRVLKPDKNRNFQFRTILAGYVPNVLCSYHICDVICDLLLNRRTATWNLFVLYNKELNFVRIKSDGDVNRPLIDHRQEPIKMPYYINKNGLYLSWIGSELHMN